MGQEKDKIDTLGTKRRLDRPEDDGGEVDFRMRFIELKHWSQTTNMHGPGNIYRSRTAIRKLFWLLIFLGGVGMMTWQVAMAFGRFYSWPVETQNRPNMGIRLPFPAVTFCNMNPIRNKYIPRDGLWELSGNSLNQTQEEANVMRPPSPNPWGLQGDDDAYNKLNENVLLRALYEQRMSELTMNEQILFGHQLPDMLIDCTFNGRSCSPRNFSTFNNIEYGNCFTFNAFPDNITWKSLDWEKLRMAYKAGPRYGLELQLYVEQYEYAPLSESAGIRVLIHNQSEMPFPEDFGLNMAPGTVTYVALTRTEVDRLPKPYGNCATYTGEENLRKNAYTSEHPYLMYTHTACVKTCLQHSIILTCGCGSPYYPISSKAFDDVTGGHAVNICRTDSLRTCVENVLDEFFSSGFYCSDQCPPACVIVNHEKSISTASWPSGIKLGETIDKLLEYSSSAAIALSEVDANDRHMFARNNLLKLNIHFEQLYYMTSHTRPSYTSIDLFGDIGGLAGLYVGLSIVTIFEFFELFGDLVITFIHFIREKTSGSRKTNPIK